ncbi:MAG TPA: hypothetical protein VKQ52_13555, partial [Puia sp.]|nr:hypothetical protein [Puia sp.]
MAVEQTKAVNSENPVYETLTKPAESLDGQLVGLAKFGGFDLLESAVDAVQNLNPSRKARKKIFLEEQSKKEERSELKKTLQWWVDILQSSDDITDMVKNCNEKAAVAEKTLNRNLKHAVSETAELERSYRSVALFFKNTESLKVKNVSIINAEPDQLKDLDNTRFIDTIRVELINNYDRLDLRNNYSLLILPGYLGSNKVVEKWAKIAYENKVMLITDFEHLDSPDDVMELFEAANLTGGDPWRSNVIMTCNWLVGRGKIDEIE